MDGKPEHQETVGVVVPAFRAAPYIAGVIGRIPGLVSHIVVVDDGSPDDQLAELERVTDHRLTVVRHEQNRGVGAAMMSGYEESRRLGCTIVVKVDADGQMDPERIEDLIAPLVDKRADFAKGNRFLHSRELRGMPLLRRLGNIVLTFLTKCASGYWSMFDPTNGYTAIRTIVWEKIDKSRIARDYFFESSLLIELGCLRAVVEDVAIPARYEGELSSLSTTRAALVFPWKLLRGLVRRLRLWYFLHDFTPVSLFLICGSLLLVFSFGWGGYHWWRSSTTGIVATTGTVMLAVVPLILGAQLILQALALDMQNVPNTPVHMRSGSVGQGNRRPA